MSLVYSYLRLPEQRLDAALADEDEARRLMTELRDSAWAPPSTSGLGLADAGVYWDAIAFVLSHERGAGGRSLESTAERAIRGSEEPPDAEGSDWVGYSRPGDAREIAGWMQDVDILALAEPLEGELEEAEGRGDLYRLGYPEDIAEAFGRVGALYREAAERGQAVLVLRS